MLCRLSESQKHTATETPCPELKFSWSPYHGILTLFTYNACYEVQKSRTKYTQIWNSYSLMAGNLPVHYMFCWSWAIFCLNSAVSSKIYFFNVSFGKSSSSMANRNGSSATGWKESGFIGLYILTEYSNLIIIWKYSNCMSMKCSQTPIHT